MKPVYLKMIQIIDPLFVLTIDTNRDILCKHTLKHFSLFVLEFNKRDKLSLSFEKNIYFIFLLYQHSIQ